jgi:hypothetical protein
MKHPVSLLTTLFLVLGIVSHAASAEGLNVVYSGKWPPYADANLPEQGLGVDLVTTALQRAGYETFLNIDSLDRILEEISIRWTASWKAANSAYTTCSRRPGTATHVTNTCTTANLIFSPTYAL